MPRRVSNLVYWNLDAGVWMLWCGALETVFGWGRPAAYAGVILYLWSFVADLGKSVYYERKAAKREGRAALGFGALARRPVELPAVPLSLATAQRFATDLALAVTTMIAVGWVCGHRSTQFFPVGLTLLAAYCAAKLWLPSFADTERFRRIALSGADPAV